MAKRGRPCKQVPLSEKSKKLVDKGLLEAKEGKIIPMEIIGNDLVEKNNNSISQERKDKLKQVMRDINKSMKGVVVNYANTIENKNRMSFGYKTLDSLTGGGVQCGCFSTIWGSKGCGKSTIAYKTIATAQKNGKIAMYVDMERSYDAEWAKNFGVDTDNLIYVSVHSAEEALDIIIKTCKEKVVDLVVLDSIQGLSPHDEQYEGKAEKEKSVEQDTMALLARKLSQFFRMSTPFVSDAKCAVLLIGQSRMDLSSFIKMETLSGGRALLHNSRLILHLRRGQGADAPTEKIETDEKDKNGKNKFDEIKIGFSLVIRVDKSQISGCVEGQELQIPFLYESGIKEE